MYFSILLLRLVTDLFYVYSQQTPCCYKPPVSNCNCTCNANQDLPVSLKSLEAKLDRVESLIGLNNNATGLSDAVKSLEAKMESLIALMNNTSFLPPRTPKPAGNLQEKYELMLNFKFISFDFNINDYIWNFWLLKFTTAAAALVSSCKEQYEKDK